MPPVSRRHAQTCGGDPFSHRKPNAAKGPHAGVQRLRPGHHGGFVVVRFTVHLQGRADQIGPALGDLLAEDVRSPAEVILIVFLVPQTKHGHVLSLEQGGGHSVFIVRDEVVLQFAQTHRRAAVQDQVGLFHRRVVLCIGYIDHLYIIPGHGLSDFVGHNLGVAGGAAKNNRCFLHDGTLLFCFEISLC